MSGRTLRAPGMGLRRAAFFGVVLATTAAAALLMLEILRAAGITPLELVILGLFLPTFAWIALAFWNALIGFTLGVLRRDPLGLGPLPTVPPPGEGEGPAAETALVMPCFDEDPARTFAGLEATLRSLARTGHAARFHVYFLSDSADPAVVSEEEAAWAALVERWEARRDARDRPASFTYRRRLERTGRKAGNVADFCRRWGDDVDFMVVLDADSVMSGETLVRLARTLEANPGAALLQTVPVPRGERTWFGRFLEVGANLYSPMLAAGQAFWQGDAANYWGHNAIVRVGPFREHARLPVLPGSPPLGGAVLSHDFVEAALLRRAGWGVWLLPDLPGSLEGVPGNLLDYATRDRRWCQGSLQHLRLLLEPGLHPLSRLHFLLGAMGYLASFLWLLLLLAGTVYVGTEVAELDLLLTRDTGLAGGWVLPGLPAAPSLLGVTAVVLFLPKALGAALALRRPPPIFRGRLRMLAGAAAEGLFSVVVAPVMMLYHARFVTEIVVGRTVGWSPQRRDDRSVPWSAALRGSGWIAAIGLIWSLGTLALSPLFFLWLVPIFFGLWVVVPLVRWSSLPVPAGGTAPARPTGPAAATARRPTRGVTGP